MDFITDFDVAVIGAGHAGVEAAMAAAKLGAKTAIFTLSLDTIANLPCNPSIGGTAKGHLVREIDAMGGCMGIAADATFLQSRMLNKAKGPAVHSLRVQTDRAQYHLFVKKMLENQTNLQIIQGEVVEVLCENSKIIGLKTALGVKSGAKAIIIASGTYLNGRVFSGNTSISQGPDSSMPALQLTDSLKDLGLNFKRFKTGTPARVHRRSIDFSKLEKQAGDEPVIPFSFLK
jgi:tRNA uridine 5-carboxymethylaminomethyl modification enzyme